MTTRVDNGLVRAIAAADRGGGDGAASRADWTAEDAGGFHYVLVPVGRRRPGRWPGLAVERVLGDPFYEDAERALWVVPGVGTDPTPADPPG